MWMSVLVVIMILSLVLSCVGLCCLGTSAFEVWDGDLENEREVRDNNHLARGGVYLCVLGIIPFVLACINMEYITTL